MAEVFAISMYLSKYAKHKMGLSHLIIDYFVAAAGKEAPVVTPLMMYVRQQRAAKSMAQVHLFLN